MAADADVAIRQHHVGPFAGTRNVRERRTDDRLRSCRASRFGQQAQTRRSPRAGMSRRLSSARKRPRSAAHVEHGAAAPAAAVRHRQPARAGTNQRPVTQSVSRTPREPTIAWLVDPPQRPLALARSRRRNPPPGQPFALLGSPGLAAAQRRRTPYQIPVQSCADGEKVDSCFLPQLHEGRNDHVLGLVLVSFS